MAYIGKQITVNGVIYTPLSADPSNPKEGQLFYSDGTIRAEGLWVYKNSNWSQVGAGVSDKSVYGQFDAEDQATTGFTNISVSGSGPINQDNSYLVSSFPASLPAVSLNPRNKLKENSVELHYTLASGTAKAVVKDQTAAIISEVELEATNDPQKVILSHFVTGSMSDLTLEFQDVSSATSLKVDDIIFSDDPFTYKNIQEENRFSARIANNGTASITSQSTNFIASVTRSAAGRIDYTFVAGFFTQAPSVVAAPSKTTVVFNDRTVNVTNITTSGFTTFLTTASTGSAQDDDVEISVMRQGSDYKQPAEHVITPAKATLTDPEVYTPTSQGFGTLNTNTVRWHREGAFMVIRGNFVSGTVDGNEAQIGLPAGFTIGDTGNTGVTEIVGTFIVDTNTNTNGGAVLATTGDTFLNFSSQSVFGAATVTATNPIAGNNVIGSGGEVSFYAKIPIQGWSSDANFLAAIPTTLEASKLVDGVTEPATISGVASLYIDSADGDLKIKFEDGTVKTIITDT